MAQSKMDFAILVEFCEITGCVDQGQAERLLESSNWVLEQAISLYMDGELAASMAPPPPTPASTNSQSNEGINLPPPAVSVYDENGVRAPDESKRARLLDHVPRHSAPRRSQIISGAFAGEDESGRNLADLFSPPVHLLFDGEFASARTQAKTMGRPLLVNIQADEEFSCHTLNRDVWKNESLGSLIQSGFVFWQESV